MNHETRVYDNIFEMLPDEQNPTPLVRLNRMNPSADFVLSQAARSLTEPKGFIHSSLASKTGGLQSDGNA